MIRYDRAFESHFQKKTGRRMNEYEKDAVHAFVVDKLLTQSGYSTPDQVDG